jgi:hypothetical protein
VLRYIAPEVDIYVSRYNLRRTARELLSVLEDHFPESSIVLFFFSNGGCFLHWELLRLHASGDAGPLQRVVGTVFDSCPVYPNAHFASSAIGEAVRTPVYKPLARGLVWFGLSVWGLCTAWSFERWVPRGGGGEARGLCGGVTHGSKHRVSIFIFLTISPVFRVLYGRSFFRAMERDPLPAPSLYIYSANDHLTDASRLRWVGTGAWPLHWGDGLEVLLLEGLRERGTRQ